MDESASDILLPDAPPEGEGSRRERLLAGLKGRNQKDPEPPRISDEELFRDPDELDTLRDLMVSFWLALKKSHKVWLSLGLLFVLVGGFLNIFYWDLVGSTPQEISEEREGRFFKHLEEGETGVLEGKITSLDYLPDLDREFYVSPTAQLEVGGLSQLLANQTLTPDLIFADRVVINKLAIGNLSLQNGVFNRVEYTDSRFINVSFASIFFLNSEFENLSFYNVAFDNVIFSDSSLKRVGFFNSTFNSVSFINTQMEQILIENSHFSATEFKDTTLKLSYLKNSTFVEGGFSSTKAGSPLTSRMLVFNNVTFKDMAPRNYQFAEVIDPAYLTRAKGYTFIDVEGLTLLVPGDQTDRFRKEVFIWAQFEVKNHGTTTNLSREEPYIYSYSYFNYTVLEAKTGDIDLTLKHTAGFTLLMLAGGAVLVLAIGGHLVLMALAKFFTPFIIGFAGIGLLFVTLNQGTFLALARWMVLYFLPPLGKESVIPAAITLDGLDWWLVALTIAFIDIVTGLFLAWNFDIAKRIPLIGAFIRRLEAKGTSLMADKPWVEKFTFFGIVLFVVVPFQGSGAVGGTIMGRALGMKPPKVWAAVIIGALMGTMAIAFGVHQGLDVASEVGYLNFILLLMALVVIAGLVWIFKHWEEVEEELGSLYEDLKSRVSFESATTFTKSIDLGRLRLLAGDDDEESKEVSNERSEEESKED